MKGKSDGTPGMNRLRIRDGFNITITVTAKA
jgi:hypothetical protein